MIIFKDFIMRYEYFNYLLTRLQAFEQVVQQTTPKLPLAAHRAKFDGLLEELKDSLKLDHGARIKAGWGPRREASKVLHFQFSNRDPIRVSYEEAAEFSGYAVSTLRMYISRSPNKAFSFYRKGRWEVLSKEASGAMAELQAKFNETGDPDDIRRLSPAPLIKS